MCEFSRNLISWLDKELDSEEAVRMDQHVAACRQCQKLAGVYQEASRAFGLFAEGIDTRAAKPARKRTAMALLAGGLAAAVIAGLLVMPRHPVDAQPRIEVFTPPAPAAALQAQPVPSIAVASRPRAVRRMPQPAQTWMPAQPTIQISIPSDALFPPGAVPEGFAFAADLRLAADGSPAELALRP